MKNNQKLKGYTSHPTVPLGRDESVIKELKDCTLNTTGNKSIMQQPVMKATYAGIVIYDDSKNMLDYQEVIDVTPEALESVAVFMKDLQGNRVDVKLDDGTYRLKLIKM